MLDLRRGGQSWSVCLEPRRYRGIHGLMICALPASGACLEHVSNTRGSCLFGVCCAACVCLFVCAYATYVHACDAQLWSCLQGDGVNLEEWFQWLAAFTGVFCKKHQYDPRHRIPLFFFALPTAFRIVNPPSLSSPPLSSVFPCCPARDSKGGEKSVCSAAKQQ